MTHYEPALALVGFKDFSVEVSKDAEQRKHDALELASTIKQVTNAQEQQDAIAACSLIKGLIKQCEEARVEIKKPVLAAGREIDDQSKLFCGTLIRDRDRLEAMMNAWQEQENKRLEVIRQEQERLNREAEAKADAERRAYLKMIQDSCDETRDAIQKAADEAAMKNAEEARARQQALVAVAPAKAEGARVVTGWEFEVTDIAETYRAMPHLVQLEPRKALIKAALELCNGQIPGIRAWTATKVQSKAATL